MAVARQPDPLFDGRSVGSYLAGRITEVADSVKPRVLRSGSGKLDKVLPQLKAQARVEPLTLHRDRWTRSSVKFDRDTSARHDSGPLDRRRLQVSVYVPYSGDPELWCCRPAPGSAIRRPDARVERDRIVIDVTIPVGQVGSEEIIHAVEAELDRAGEWLGRLEGAVEAHNRGVDHGQVIEAAVERRRVALGRRDDLEDGLAIDLAAEERVARVRDGFEAPVLSAALLVVPVIYIEEQVASPGWQQVAVWANWGIWSLFLADYAALMAYTDRRWEQTRRAWLDLLIIVTSFPLRPKWSGTEVR